jgi:hypothetical protein
VQGWSFNRVGLITKTWYNCQGVTAKFDYLAHNYTPPAIQPGIPDVDYGTSGSNATVTVTTDTDPSDGSIGASVGAAVYAYGTTDPAPDVQESWANGGLEFSVADAKTLFLNVSLGGLMGGDHIFTSEFEAAALIRNVTDNSVVATYPGSYEYLTTRPLPYGFKEVSDVQSISYDAAPGKTYRLEFAEALTATATGSGSYGWANFGGSMSAMSSEIPVEDLPQADAGSDQVVAEGTIVQLDGSLSEDPDGDGLRFAWQQVSGDDMVTLSDPTVPNPTFLATVPGLYGFELIVSDGTLSSVPDYVTVLVESASTPINVEIDLKPGTETNCVNINGHGLITVAVNGSDTFDVADVNIETVSFAGLATRVKGNGQPQCAYEDWNQDGFVDLTCHFVDDPEDWEPGEGIVTLTGELLDGTPFSGTDVLCVVP